jgi:response regulator RpfG family c-di-GMP phosphodiesterase
VQKILVVGDDEGMRRRLRVHLVTSYEVIETRDPEQALGLALEHKPDAVLVDLALKHRAGVDLCRSLRSLSYTSRIPLFAIAAEVGEKIRSETLGVTAVFTRPVDFQELQRQLSQETQIREAERRVHPRVRMRVTLKLQGIDALGKRFEEVTATDNVSASGFLCNSSTPIRPDATVEVFLAGDAGRFVGRARLVRREAGVAPWQRYGFQFVEKTREWVLQG